MPRPVWDARGLFGPGRTFLIAIAAAIAFPASAFAQPPTLAGESFKTFAWYSGPSGPPEPVGAVQTTAECNSEGTSTISFQASGEATGPYTGTFTASGTIAIAPQVDPPMGVSRFGFNTGPVATVQEEFTIDSPEGDVHGTKTLTTQLPGNYGQCVDFFGRDIPEFLQVNVDGFARLAEAQPVRYEATIQTDEGSFHDSGTSYVLIEDFNLTSPNATGFGGATFQQLFLESDGPASNVTAIELSPVTATNPVGTSHTITATVSDSGGAPLAGQTVLFSTFGSTTTTGSCSTDGQGQCAFSYQGPALPGADLIAACVDSNQSGFFEPGETCTTASKAWVLPTAASGNVTGGGQIANMTATDSIAFGFNAKADSSGAKGNCTVVDPFTDTIIKCVDVTTLVQSGNHATFFGKARINGLPTDYRIDVDDNGEPGVADTFKIQTSVGYAALGPLERGNVQIHR